VIPRKKTEKEKRSVWQPNPQIWKKKRKNNKPEVCLIELLIWVFFLNCKILFCAVTLDLICVVGGEETAVVVVVVCSLAIIAAGTSSIQSPAVAAASYINCTQRNHSVPEKKASSSKRTSTNASPNFHFTTCELDSVLYSKVFSVLFV
jgi:hypothetical protein